MRAQAGRVSESGVKLKQPDRIFITWLPFSSRSQTLAENFGAEAVYFSYLAGNENAAKVILRYLVMTLHTFFYVLWRRPRVVFVMNQPVFLPLTLMFLSFLTGVKYVIDSHSGLFNKKQWMWSLPIMKYAYRYSLFSIVTNKNHKELTESWGAKVEVLGALTVPEEPVETFKRTAKKAIVVIGTFASDEPIAEVLEACRQLSDVRIYITGAMKKAPPGMIENAPENVTFTDFQPRPNYVGLVQAMDAAMILVTHDDVMQRGAYEAMSWSVPIITSDWPILRDSFTRGTIFVDNSAADIIRSVEELYAHLPEYKAEVNLLREERQLKWDNTIGRINDYIAAQL
ncbi:glycosyltransferase [bacterium]|nr:glycosyltransferase [bacterium]